jgi:hypothetical protein
MSDIPPGMPPEVAAWIAQTGHLRFLEWWDEQSPEKDARRAFLIARANGQPAGRRPLQELPESLDSLREHVLARRAGKPRISLGVKQIAPGKH